MRQLSLDAAAAEAIGALNRAGIRVILLKGPAVADWLYDERWQRPYGDVDLLVSPDDHARAGAALAGLGYRQSEFDEPGLATHASHWRRTEPAPVEIDLHRRLHWTRADAGSWSALAAGTERLTIGRVTVETLAPDARAMLIALHAAQHGARARRPIRDLERALERVDADVWTRAAGRARQLGVQGAFALGLRLAPGGAQLADRLALTASASAEARLRAATPEPTTIGWMRLLEQRSARAALNVMRAELVPRPDFMRAWSPLARRGRRGLMAAYLGRPWWLLWHVPVAMRDLAEARRSSAG